MRFGNSAAAWAGRLLLALLLAAGCSDNDPVEVVDTGGDVAGSWTAISFAGASLPIGDYIQDPDKGACFRELRGVELTYAADGGWTWVEEVFLDCALGTVPETVTNTISGTYRVEGIRLFMQDSESDAEQEYTFTVQGNTLTMRARFGSSTISSVFQRT